MSELDMHVSTEAITAIRQRAVSSRAVRKMLDFDDGISALAKALGVTPTTLSSWADGTQNVPPIALAIVEAATAHYRQIEFLETHSIADLLTQYCKVIEFRTEV